MYTQLLNYWEDTVFMKFTQPSYLNSKIYLRLGINELK